jgi:hypothetical protein
VPLSRDDAPFPSGVPRSAFAETFEANGIMLPPRLLNTHGARSDQWWAPPGLGGAHRCAGASAAQKSWPSTRQAHAEQRSRAYSTCVSRNVTRT